MPGHSDTPQRNIDIDGSADGTVIISGDGNQVTIGLPPEQPASQRQDRNETLLIDAVWSEVEDRLNQSLHNAVLIRLDMQEQRSQVSRPWDRELRTGSAAPKPIDANTHIAEVFDRREVGGRLLILGAPGSGKTTTLLDLAAVLVQRANGQPQQPMPVLLSLSSWRDGRQGVQDWLAAELKLKYGVSQKLGKVWLQKKLLLPLLDGLDELPAERQEPVVQAINKWLQSGKGPAQLVVCSRLEEYGLYASQLALQGAVCLEPLTDGQLRQYLASLEQESLWRMFEQDGELLELVRTPLLLSVAILANEAVDVERWRQLPSAEARLEYLLDAYVERRLHEPVVSREYGEGREPEAGQVRRWLVWLAQLLEQESQDEFLIEGLQPKNILRSKRQRWLYRLIIGIVIGLFCGLLSGLGIGLFISSSNGLIFGIVTSLIFSLFLGLLFSLFFCLILSWSDRLLFGQILKPGVSLSTSLEFINIIERVELSPIRLSDKELFLKLLSGLILGLLAGFLAALPIVFNIISPTSVLGIQHHNLSLFEIISTLIIGATIGLFISLVIELKKEVSSRISPNQAIRQSARNILPIALFFYPIGVGLSLAQQLSEAGDMLAITEFDILRTAFESIVWAMLFGFFFGGGLACTQHFSLRLVLHRAGYMPWNYARFLNHCAERLLLQRVGGRYRFIHRLVLEHFARMQPPGG